jgi:hypothetical protein
VYLCSGLFKQEHSAFLQAKVISFSVINYVVSNEPLPVKVALILFYGPSRQDWIQDSKESKKGQ